MTISIVTVSQYIAAPPLQVITDSTLEVRGWYSRDFISADGVTPVWGNSFSGNEGPYYSLTPTLDASGDLVVPAHDIQATTLSNPTGNYFEGLWVNGAFSMLLMPNTNGATGWQIPTTYGDIISYDEIATYNRARRLVYAPNTYWTADQVIEEIRRLAGNFDYMAVGVNGIGSIDTAPAVTSLPIVIGVNSRRASDFYNIIAYGADTAKTAAQNATAIAAAVTAATITGGGIYIPVGTFVTNSVIVSVPIEFAQGASILSVATGQTLVVAKAMSADISKHFTNIGSGLGVLSLSGNTSLDAFYPQWLGAIGDGSTDCTAAFQAMLHLVEYNGTVTGIRFVVPTGVYCISTTLTYKGDFGHSFLLEGVSQGESATGDGPTFKWTGASGGTIMQWLGANWCQARNIQFNGNALALRDLLIDYDSGRSQSSFDCFVDHCTFGGVVGTDSTCLVLGTSAFASAEHRISNSRFEGYSTAGTSYYGIASFGSANCKNYTVTSCDIGNFKWGARPSNSGYFILDGCSFAGNAEGDVKPVGGSLSIQGGGSEGSVRLVDGSAVSGSVAGTLSIEDIYFAGFGDSSEYVVIFPGQLTVKNCIFGAGPSLGDNPPKFKINIDASTGGGVVSLNNQYNWNAATSADFIPFYSTSDQLIGTLPPSGVTDNLFSTGDSSHATGSIISFPAWSIRGNIGVYPKVILAAFWGSANTYTIAYGDSVILTECATGPFGSGFNVISLAAPSTGKGLKHLIIKTDTSAFPIAVSNGFAANINGTKLDSVLLTNQFDFVELESDGTSWRVIRYNIGELGGQVTVGGGGSVTYTWKNRWATAPRVVTSDTNAAPAVTGANSTTTTLTVTGTAAHVVNYIGTAPDLG